MNNISLPLDIGKYQNVCLLLQDYYSARKGSEASFSYGVWAQELGCKNRSYLRLVVMGKRPVNSTLLKSLLSSFQLNSQDEAHLTALVHLTQSRSAEEKHVWQQRIQAFAGVPADQVEASEYEEFLSDHLLPCLHTVFGFQDAPSEVAEVAEAFGISPEEAQIKIRKLESLKLYKDQQRTQRSWKVAPQNQAPGHREFYRQSLVKAAQAMDMPAEDRKFRSLFVAMNEKEFSDFLADFEQFAREQLAKRNFPTVGGRRLFQLNFNFFAITKAFRSRS